MRAFPTSNRRGFTLLELMIAVAIILILSGVLYSNLRSHLLLTRETAAIRHITAIHQAQTQYYAQFGRYAKSLSELGPRAADLLPRALAEGKNGGYVYTVSERPDGYVVNANPETFGNSGRRTFYSDQTLVVRNNWNAEPATATSLEIQ